MGRKRCRDKSRTKCCRLVYISIWGIMLMLHVMAWSSKWFCDWYLTYIYGRWVDTYGRAMGRIPFCVGEILIGLGIGFGAVGILLGPGWLLDRIRSGHRKRTTGSGRFQRFARAYTKAALWLLLGVFILMTLNCYILYHASGFAETYLETAATQYSLEELETLRNFVVGQCNMLCVQIPRNEDGSLSYEGDMTGEAQKTMGELGKTYHPLSGFYPVPKPLRCSDFMSQQYVAGCFYPFSMEANYNDVMYVMNKPSTMCHELAHLKGFMREDEANLVGYLACVQSEDIYFRYSGYLSVLYYIDNAYREAAGYVRYQAGPEILPQVREDNIFLPAAQWARIEHTALFDTKTVDVVSDKVADTRLKLNGVEEGMASYSGVVQLLLQYYDLYPYP